MGKARIPGVVGEAAVNAVRVDGAEDRATVATAVRYLLQVLEAKAPGKTVEVRVPPFGAVQCVGEGPQHRRGTPPNVVEMDAPVFLALATGTAQWDDAVKEGCVRSSGSRSDLAQFFPFYLEDTTLGAPVSEAPVSEAPVSDGLASLGPASEDRSSDDLASSG